MCLWWWLVNHHWWQDGSKTSSSFFIACFLCFLLVFFPSLKGLHLPGPSAKSEVWSSVDLSPFPSLCVLVRSRSPAHGSPGARSRKRRVKGFRPVHGRAQRPWQRTLNPQLLLILRRTAVWSAANHPWTCSCAAEGTTRCGHKVSLASSARQVECRRHCTITRTHDSRKQTHLYDVFAISFHSKDNSRYPGFIWCKTAIRWKCCTERYFFKQLPLCACEIPTFTLAMSPSILQLTPPHNKTAEYKIEFWPPRLLFFFFFF